MKTYHKIKGKPTTYIKIADLENVFRQPMRVWSSGPCLQGGPPLWTSYGQVHEGKGQKSL